MLLLAGRRLSPFLDHPRRSLASLVLVSIVAAVAEGAAILVVVRVAVELASDTVSADFVPVVGAPTRPITAIAIAGGFALVTLGAHYLIARESSSAAAQVLRRSRERAIRAYRKATWPTQARQRLGSLQETVATLSLLTSAMANLLATGVANLVMLAVFLMIAFVVNPAAMAFVTIAGIGILAAIRPLTRRNQAASNAFTRVDSHFSEEMTNFAAGVMELRSFGVLEKAGERLENDLGTVVERLRVVRFRTALATTLYRDIAVLMLIGSVGALVLTGADSVGSSSAIVVLIVRAMASAQAVNSMVQNIGERGATLELLIERIEELEADPDEPGSVALERLDRLELRGVQYAYGEGSPVLKGVDLVVDRGRVIGVTGPSGSGKSTLLQLLLGLREPTAGRLMVNGTDIRAIDDADWARSVAYVPQEPTLFEQSIAENVAFFRDISRERVVQAAVAANVYDELMRFPSGIDTWLGPLGSGLSGGQKQRVALARALAGDPDLMVLDEPSSALDAAAEVAFRETIRDLAARDCAVLIVSHRPESLEVCDAVFRMEDGVLVPQVQPAGDEAPAGDR